MGDRIHQEFAVDLAMPCGRRTERARPTVRLLLSAVIPALVLALGEIAGAEDASVSATIEPTAPAHGQSASPPDDALLKLAEYAETLESRSSTQPGSGTSGAHVRIHSD